MVQEDTPLPEGHHSLYQQHLLPGQNTNRWQMAEMT